MKWIRIRSAGQCLIYRRRSYCLQGHRATRRSSSRSRNSAEHLHRGIMNPTVDVLEKRLAAPGRRRRRAGSSARAWPPSPPRAAEHLPAGQHIVSSSALRRHGHALQPDASAGSVSMSLSSMPAIRELRQGHRDNTRLVYIESSAIRRTMSGPRRDRPSRPRPRCAR